jgi:hypothetical protein
MSTERTDTYPALVLCEVCNERMTDVVGPGDWAVCWLCELALKDELNTWGSLSQAIRDEERWGQADMAVER